MYNSKNLAIAIIINSIIAVTTILIVTDHVNAQLNNNPMIDIILKDQTQQTTDNSKKRILARGCDPQLSLRFAKVAPQYLGNVEYIPTTNDLDFFEKLKSEKWSLVYFAPGACRYSAANMQIPGGNIDTKSWTLDQYSKVIQELQGEEIQIVKTVYEAEALTLLRQALNIAREVK